MEKLYDKAHGYRDLRTLDEDLVHRFLDGLHDDAPFEVEYHKDQTNIDEAVYHAVCMIQCKSASRLNKRASNTWRAVSQGSDHRSDQSISTSEGNSEPSNLEVLQAVKQLTERVQKLEEKRPSQQKRGQARKPNEYFYCHQEGHFIKDCPKKEKGNIQSKVSSANNTEWPLNCQGPTLAAKGGSQ